MQRLEREQAWAERESLRMALRDAKRPIPAAVSVPDPLPGYDSRWLPGCQSCGARAGEPCVSKAGKAVLKRPHVGRNEPNPEVRRREKSALRRGYSWEITDEHVIELMAMACTYCGGSGGGIDRSNNDLGYTLSNVVPCCGTCNLMKRKHTLDEWIGHIRKVIAHSDLVQAKGREAERETLEEWAASVAPTCEAEPF